MIRLPPEAYASVFKILSEKQLSPNPAVESDRDAVVSRSRTAIAPPHRHSCRGYFRCNSCFSFG